MHPGLHVCMSRVRQYRRFRMTNSSTTFNDSQPQQRFISDCIVRRLGLVETVNAVVGVAHRRVRLCEATMKVVLGNKAKRRSIRRYKTPPNGTQY